MSDALTNQPFPGINPGDPVAEVDPHDLKTFCDEARNLMAKFPDQNVGIADEAMKGFCKPGTDTHAVWYRSTMILVLNKYAPDQLAPWVYNEEFSDAVFRTMATIPMEWVEHTNREGFPFDVDEFFRRLENHSSQNG